MPIELHTDEHTLHKAINERLNDFNRRHQHRHELRVLTCYVEFDAVRSLINMVAKEVKLTTVTLMFDYSEIYRRRTPAEAAKALQSLTNSCRDQRIEFAWAALKAGL